MGRSDKTLRVSNLFHDEISRMAREMNLFLEENNVPKQVSLKDTADLIFVHSDISLFPTEVIKRGRKGKRLLFQGEIRL